MKLLIRSYFSNGKLWALTEASDSIIYFFASTISFELTTFITPLVQIQEDPRLYDRSCTLGKAHNCHSKRPICNHALQFYAQSDELFFLLILSCLVFIFKVSGIVLQQVLIDVLTLLDVHPFLIIQLKRLSLHFLPIISKALSTKLFFYVSLDALMLSIIDFEALDLLQLAFFVNIEKQFTVHSSFIT